MQQNDKKIVVSAVQPTGMLTIGNYAGAIQNWVSLQEDYTCFFSIADLHSLTLSMDGAALRHNTLGLYAMLIACGIDTDKSTLFVQSAVPEHASLAWILNCYTQYGEARRMTQFKDKSARHADNVNVGLFAYPILQAADILLYNAHYVPVGQDQKQHIELSRTIAERFNNRFSSTFNVPDVLIPKISGKINSLTNPSVKMSKSDDNAASYILMTDSSDDIVRKFKRAQTDSEGTIEIDEARSGINNLINIYATFGGISPKEVVTKYSGSSYEVFKRDIAELVISVLAPIQSEYARLVKDKGFLLERMTSAAQRATYCAKRTLSKVNKKIGL